jgi:hypothetical protein
MEAMGVGRLVRGRGVAHDDGGGDDGRGRRQVATPTTKHSRLVLQCSLLLYSMLLQAACLDIYQPVTLRFTDTLNRAAQ